MAVSTTILAGILLFFLLEKLVIWHHCHDEICEVHGKLGHSSCLAMRFTILSTVSSSPAAFLTSFPLGVAAALAVFAHEIPQKVSVSQSNPAR